MIAITPQQPGPKVLVVDDEVAIRRLLGATLARAGYRVVEATNAREALNALSIDKPDLVLLDLGLPDRDGLEVLSLMRGAGVALMVISARDATAEKVAALDLGASDYITKPFDSEEVLARIRATLRQRLEASTERTLVEFGEITIDLVARVVRRAGVEVHLSPKEYGFLAELAAHPGRVISHAQILRQVWGPGHEGSVEYLRVAARGIRRKLEDVPVEASAIRNEPGVGYRLII